MLSNILYLVIGVSSLASLIYAFKPVINKYLFKLKLENEFLDFLSILLTLEASGLRLDNVFEEAFNKRLILPSSYMVLARDYMFLSKINPDPYSCLRRLADRIPSSRVADFIRGYSEVLVSTNDTLRYVESFTREEFNSLKNTINNYVGLLDNLFEAYMIVLLGIIVYSIMPITSFPIHIVLFLITGLSIAAYMIALKLLNLALINYSSLESATTLAVIALSPLILLNNPSLYILHLTIVFIVGALLVIATNYVIGLEKKFLVLLEDLYSETRQGVSIDYALTRVGYRYGEPVDRVVDLLKLGLKPFEIIKSFKLPLLSSKVLRLTLAPIEYSRGSGGYLGYVLGIVESVRGLRRSLEERGRIYYLYVLILVVLLVVLTKVLGREEVFSTSMDTSFVKTVSYISLFESIIIASTISRGYWFRSLATYLLLVIAVIATYLIG